MPVTRCLPLFALLLLPAFAAEDTAPPEGIRDRTPGVHALVNARIVVAPGRALDKGTLLIRDGLIEAVGEGLPVPPDARVHDLSGKVLYPGFLDAWAPWEAAPAAPKGALHWNPKAHPERRVDLEYVPDPALNRQLRAQGICVRFLAPSVGVIRGTGAAVTTGDAGARQAVVSPRASFQLGLDPGAEEGYPVSVMGAVALLRQGFLDADWHRRAWEAHAKGAARPEANAGLAALGEALAGSLPLVVEAGDEIGVLRVHRLAREFRLSPVVLGSGREYRRLEAVAETGLPLLIPLKMPDPPKPEGSDAARDVPLDELMHWDLAPENPARLAGAGVRFAFTARGMKPEAFLPALRKVRARGLSADATLAALTTVPAALLGLSDRLGTLEAGRAAHVVVCDADLFDPDGKARVLETWVDGRRYGVDPFEEGDPRGLWEGTAGASAFGFSVSGEPGKLSGKLGESKLQKVQLDAGRLLLRAEGKALGKGEKDLVLLEAVLAADAGALEGTGTWPDGTVFSWKALRKGPAPPAEEDDEEKKKEEDKKEKEPRTALFEPNFPLGAYGRQAPPEQPEVLMFLNATVWTCAGAGILEGASVLVRKGRIEAVGRDLKTPEGARVVDLAGKHLTPGIVDCHSHIAIGGGVNEGTQSVTAEVRIGDVLDPDDIAVYRELAGGVTAANLLHGSANAIGGQNQVIKLRWGALPEAMKLAGAPEGIKFALGENPKQSNWDRHDRYPQTRMGVEQLIRDSFQAAKDYRASWAAWERSPRGLPPRRDLELEAVAEILEGKRLLHCHAYRQDEMLALMRVCEAYGVKVATFQHALEGYKVADEMRRHGAGASTFSDWWAYKMEVYDAIPYNAALLASAGVLVSLNSDSAELGRRLHTEAAKTLKYGGMSEEEALKLVTANPARQLGVSARIGSIEPGKDADLAVWSASPLSAYAVCEQTWIDGRRFFDREEDLRLRAEAVSRHAALLQRALKAEDSGEGGGKAGGRRRKPREGETCCDP